MILPLLLLISSYSCDTVMSRLQKAKTFGEAVHILDEERLDKEQLAFWSKAFHMKFSSQEDFRSHLELLEEARLKIDERKNK